MKKRYNTDGEDYDMINRGKLDTFIQNKMSLYASLSWKKESILIIDNDFYLLYILTLSTQTELNNRFSIRTFLSRRALGGESFCLLLIKN